METTYRKLSHSGLFSIIGGLCVITLGILVVISGGLLLRRKNDLLF
ncbi:MAG: hypothetical protein LIO56_07640 [Lachnospiraceae bacterium]|nr:hypothetical protein [Lachnospiraceae bacterium]